jgi:primosomal protein N' (replication factor Y)
MVYVEVSVAAPHTSRRFYTYSTSVPVRIGDIVQVPFARKSAFGIVRTIVKKPTFVTKEITAITDLTMSTEAVHLLTWLESFYPYDFGEISNLFIPPNVLTNSRHNQETLQQKSTVSALPELNEDQKNALSIITHNRHTLLHGDTGTGKTRVFLEYANSQLSAGKAVLILTPEIGLTPQLEQTIRSMCPYPVHVIHSQKTPAHRKKIWQTAQKNEQPSLYIGPRSSLFLPYKNLGLVVIDEAHDSSYKSMQSPKYNALYVAAQLAHIHDATFIQSTATPNVSDYSIAMQKNIPIARMTTIAAGVEKPAVGAVIDMTDASLFTTHKLLSDPLIAAIADALQKNEQSMLFLNRRGSARVVQCNSCGHIELCKQCGLPLTFHHDSHTLSCHICATKHKATNQCSTCLSVDILYFSPGTKGLEQEVTQLFPKARVARFDLDVSAKDAIHKKLSELQNGAFDIIIGTQLISKGFDLPSLSVVGVLNADSGLAIPDFRAEEITFQQLYQVTGRVGRGHTLSKYFIQTRQPNNPVIEAALQRNWHSYYSYELHKRKQYLYPPYTHLALLSITKSKQATAQKAAEGMAHTLATQHLSVLGPSPSYHETAQGGYTWQLLLKAPRRSTLIHAIQSLPSEWNIDIDPINVL